MTETPGWRPVNAARRQTFGAESFRVSPFQRLARTHVLSVACDALVTVSLAGSLFFSIPTGAARGKVALYLALTMAPFALVSPLIGPAIDRLRGGRRLMVMVACLGKGVAALFMLGHVDDLLLFPAAFTFLVLGKAYQIAKSALVPSVVDDDSGLVRANSQLSLLSAITAVVAGAPAAGLVKLLGPGSALFLAALAGAGATVLATKLPRSVVAPEPPDAAEKVELRGAGIILAAEAMGVLRGLVGFLSFLLAFDLRGGANDGPVPLGLAMGRAVRQAADFPAAGAGAATAPAWHFGIVLAAASVGTLVGSVVAPRLRERLVEERILLAMLVGTAAVAGLAAFQGGLAGAAAAAVAVAVGAAAGRLAFDSIIQRDAPDANFGRSFAKFETRFQVVWVVGAFIPVFVSIPARFGYVLIALVAAFAAFGYYAGGRRIAGGAGHRSSPQVPV